MNSSTPTLPIEIFEMIIEVSPRDALPSLIRSNSTAYAVGCRALYRTIGDSGLPLTPRRYIILLKTLITTTEKRPPYLPHPGTFVAKLYLRFDSKHIRVSANLLRLVHRALHSLPHIKALGLNLSFHDGTNYLHRSLTWVFERFTVPLDSFMTTLPCNAALARFLESQPTIRTLCLRPHKLEESFVLSPDALPVLETVWFKPPPIVQATKPRSTILRSIVSNRPIQSICSQHVTVGYSSLGPAPHPLDVATMGSCPLSSLSITIFDARPEFMIKAVSIRLPTLQKLELRSKEYTLESALDAAVHLKAMHKLEKLSMIVTGPVLALTLESKRRIVEACKKSCPSIRFVCLGPEHCATVASFPR